MEKFNVIETSMIINSNLKCLPLLASQCEISFRLLFEDNPFICFIYLSIFRHRFDVSLVLIGASHSLIYGFNAIHKRDFAELNTVLTQVLSVAVNLLCLSVFVCRD